MLFALRCEKGFIPCPSPGCQVDGAPSPVTPAPLQQRIQRTAGKVGRRVLTKSNERHEQVVDRLVIIKSWRMGLLAQLLTLLVEYDRDVKPAWRKSTQGTINLLLLRRPERQAS